MKVTFNYTPCLDGHKLTMQCSEMTQLESGAYDQEEYYNCFKAIQEQVNNTVKMHEEKKTPLTGFEIALLSFLQDASNEFNSEKEVDYFIKKHSPKLLELAKKENTV